VLLHRAGRAPRLRHTLPAVGGTFRCKRSRLVSSARDRSVAVDATQAAVQRGTPRDARTARPRRFRRLGVPRRHLHASDMRASAARSQTAVNRPVTPMTRSSQRPAFVLVAGLPQKSGPYRKLAAAARPWAVFVFGRYSRRWRFASKFREPS